MLEINWNMTVEDVLAESRLLLADIFGGTNYSIMRNPKSGEKMNNVYLNGIDGRIAYIESPEKSKPTPKTTIYLSYSSIFTQYMV